VTTWDLEPELEWEDRPSSGPAPEVLDHPEDWAEDTLTAGNWTGPHVARKWHDCSLCRDIIGPGDPYLRQAVLVSPNGTCRGRFVIVTKLCCDCMPYPT
jgi:hypothetical protein